MKRPSGRLPGRIAALPLGLTLASVPHFAAANDLLNLYHEAQQQDQTLQAAIHQRDATVEARPQALATLLPQVAGTAAHGRDREHELSSNQTVVATGGTTGTTGANQYNTTVSGATYFTEDSYSLTLTQAIFDWSAFQTLAQSNKQAAEAQATLVAAQQSLIYRVADAYFSVLYAQDTLSADIDARNSYRQQLDQSQKKFDVGLAAITDVRNAQASYDSSAATVISDQQALDSARRSLGQIIGRPIKDLAGLQDEIPLIAPNPVAVDDWVHAAAQDNPTLLNYQYAADVAKKQIGVNRGQYLPTLSVVGSLGRDRTNSDLGSDVVTDSISLQANWNIFEGGRTRSLVRQASASYDQALATYEGQRRNIDQSTRDAYEGVISGIASVRANKQAVVSNQTSLQASQVGLKVGTRTEVDVLTAQQALATAQRAYYLSRYNYLRSVLSLKQDSGRIREQDLADVDHFLTPAPVPAPTAPDIEQSLVPQAP